MSLFFTSFYVVYLNSTKDIEFIFVDNHASANACLIDRPGPVGPGLGGRIKHVRLVLINEEEDVLVQNSGLAERLEQVEGRICVKLGPEIRGRL